MSVCLSCLTDDWTSYHPSFIVNRHVTLLFVQWSICEISLLFLFRTSSWTSSWFDSTLNLFYLFLLHALIIWMIWNRLTRCTCSLNINRRTFSYLLLFHDIYYLAITLVNIKHHARLCIKWPGLESAESELFRSVLWLSATRIPP